MLRLADDYAGNPDFAVAVTDNAGNRGRALTLEKLRRQGPENLDDLRRRAQTFVAGYFRDHAAENPALTESLRQRILGSYDEGLGGRDSGPRNRQPQ